jgi:hypothetical protein
VNWQPIETAPKDGRPVLLFADAETTGPVWAVAKWSSYAIKGVKDYGWLIALDPSSGAAVEAVGATHWMPPPAGPNAMTEH